MSKLKILLVDDDDVDYMNVKRAFRKNNIDHELEYKPNGLEGLEYLRSVKNSDELPHVILLDINMPKMNGHEFLKELRSDDKLKHIVVYVLTTSSQNSDISKAYSQQVSGYLVKPLDFTEFKTTVKKLSDLWNVQKFPFGNHG